MNKTVALTLFATLLTAPAFAQDAPPATSMEQSTDEQAQMKAEDEQQTAPPATTDESMPAKPPMTTNDASDAMQTTAPPTSEESSTATPPTTSNDASAAMQSTGTSTAATAATATGAGVTSTVLPTANVTVTSHPGNSISSNYHVDFAGLDSNHDGNLSHGEVNASGNADLIREFVAVDINRNGRLSKDEMKGWTD